jgi:hypothetical protein
MDWGSDDEGKPTKHDAEFEKKRAESQALLKEFQKQRSAETGEDRGLKRQQKADIGEVRGFNYDLSPMMVLPRSLIFL